MHTLLFLASLLLPSAQAACTITLDGPRNNATPDSSPSFRWTGSADCVEYSVWFSPSGDFQSDDLTKTQRRTNASFRMNDNAWTTHVATDWADGVYWRVKGWTASGVVSSSKVRFLAPLPDIDADGDGYTVAAGDCDDDDATVGLSISWYIDFDGDGFGSSAQPPMESCAPLGGYADNAEDCEDVNPLVHPFASETCDAIDNDCDGMTDEGCP